ncbi:hypothetical protein [Nocardia pseudovaccinii]|uniref:hypothetical protein n=1 Tax=Nocardia pseudovaccinii TaxID=189540 RepID=UPI0007A45CBD|nr:hypothetical protein [Nocardia pseudovaccinii]
MTTEPTAIRLTHAELHSDPWERWLRTRQWHLETFFSQDVPEMPSHIYSLDGLRRAEQLLLRRLPTIDSIPLGDWVIDRAGIYLGTVLERNFPVRWTNRTPPKRDRWAIGTYRVTPQLVFESNQQVIDLNYQVAFALAQRSGTHWQKIYEHAAANLASHARRQGNPVPTPPVWRTAS